MSFIPQSVKEIVGLDGAFLAIFILATIVGIETGILGGLVTRVGSLKNLFRITADEANNRTNNTRNKRNPSTQKPDSKESPKSNFKSSEMRKVMRKPFINNIRDYIRKK